MPPPAQQVHSAGSSSLCNVLAAPIDTRTPMDTSDLSPTELKDAMQPGLKLLRQWAADRGVPADGQEMTKLRDTFEQRLIFAIEQTDATLLGAQWSWSRALSRLSVYTAQALIQESGT